MGLLVLSIAEIHFISLSLIMYGLLVILRVNVHVALAIMFFNLACSTRAGMERSPVSVSPRYLVVLMSVSAPDGGGTCK